jgi:hypothetical protein
MSVAEGRAEVFRMKPDIGLEMSGFWGKAEVLVHPSKRLGLARIEHSIHNLRVALVKDYW